MRRNQGNEFIGAINNSADGRGTWVPVAGIPSFVVASNAWVGVFAASGTDRAISAATFENLAISVPSLPPPADAGAPPDAR